MINLLAGLALSQRNDLLKQPYWSNLAQESTGRSHARLRP